MRLFFTFVLLLPVLTLAEEQADNAFQLTVKPVLCIIDNRNPNCDMSFLVIWQSVKRGYYCLHNDLAEVPVHCWSEERAGRLDDDRIVQDTFSYWMTGDDTDIRLAEVVVEVLRMDSDDRRRKRRKRHVWDIN
ncbi:MAG: DUF3019 domain-containing protein [Gammaproteobacteria bacterium]|nr:DUF3019 domain-containing protein [Gammaproteobacteria bacterium]